MAARPMFLFFVLALVCTVECQQNSIRPLLVQCYNESAIPGITNPERRPPATLNILLEIIRRLEDANPNVSARDLSILILQRLRQDGIMNNGQTVSPSYGIPFGLLRPERFRTTEILNSYLQNSSTTFRFGDLTPKDICSLHYMISSTIDHRVRGDESMTCNKAAKYSFRARRDIEKVEPRNGMNADVERVGNGLKSSEKSQCPLELGVLFTNYGTIKGGQVLAGIASGFNFQRAYSADNRYASTIAGELAEAALSQGPDNIEIGVEGGWNSTICPQYYFLQKNDGLEVTDAEIRGSLDGFYMAMKLENWRTYDIKISQIIDMYYTPYQKGVLQSGLKACNRNILYTEITNEADVKRETLAFMSRLDDTSSYGITVNTDAYPSLTDVAYKTFMSYLPQMNTNDPSCVPVEIIDRVSSDLLIFVDAGWEYRLINLILSNILDGIDVNRFGTRYTIFNGLTGYNLTTNRTNNLLDFYNQYNLPVHRNYSSGFDYAEVYRVLEDALKSKLENKTYYGKESTIALLIPRSPPSQDQRNFLESKRVTTKSLLPDLNFIVLGVGTQGDYSSLILNQDFVSLSDSTSDTEIKTTGQTVITRIKNLNRAIVNPSCGSSFTGSANSFDVNEFVEPNGINYYKIHPNYFFTGNGGRVLKISENGYGSIKYCLSRTQTKPSNASDSCKVLRSTGEMIDISNFCSGRLSDCAPIYLSVEGVSSIIKCREYGCRFPNNIKYTIRMENVGCASSGTKIAIKVLGFALVLMLALL